MTAPTTLGRVCTACGKRYRASDPRTKTCGPRCKQARDSARRNARRSQPGELLTFTDRETAIQALRSLADRGYRKVAGAKLAKARGRVLAAWFRSGTYFIRVRS